jgi:hypothetical protein
MAFHYLGKNRSWPRMRPLKSLKASSSSGNGTLWATAITGILGFSGVITTVLVNWKIRNQELDQTRNIALDTRDVAREDSATKRLEQQFKTAHDADERCRWAIERANSAECVHARRLDPECPCSLEGEHSGGGGAAGSSPTAVTPPNVAARVRRKKQGEVCASDTECGNGLACGIPTQKREYSAEQLQASDSLSGGLGGVSEDRYYFGPCKPGYSRYGNPTTIKNAGAGNCQRVWWASESPKDCRVVVHYGLPVLGGVQCVIVAQEIRESTTEPVAGAQRICTPVVGSG